MVASRRGDSGAEEKALSLLDKVNLTSHRNVKGSSFVVWPETSC